MRSRSWLLAAAVLCFHGPYVDGNCLDVADCMVLESNEQRLHCIQECTDIQDFTHESLSSPDEEEVEEESLSLGLLLSALSPVSTKTKGSSEEPLRGDERRSYSMEHFRWGKPIGRKRRPVKVFANGALEAEPEESTETVRVDRRQDETVGVRQSNNAKTNGKYRMSHFRWNTPPDKRYGGFMRSSSEQSHKPLLTLIRNAMVRDGQQFKN
ncbi:proopiomelanocortin b [Misgurnus anguillicaudatus]|uniref:proopiomelanocortin b n=1 Tax=Misgurnus anguillicaudatus TaxID=75329 RepID=UPI002435CD99|nr:proopiomelanocortin b [Misgurnus anguillicaudatus]